jgi:hypothetical protein
LSYQLVQEPSEQQIIEQCVRAGWDLPEKITNAPSLSPGLELYYMGFMDLISSRHGSSPIWWITVQEYCERAGCDEEQTEAMHLHLRNMDAVYLKQVTKK